MNTVLKKRKKIIPGNKYYFKIYPPKLSNGMWTLKNSEREPINRANFGDIVGISIKTKFLNGRTINLKIYSKNLQQPVLLSEIKNILIEDNRIFTTIKLEEDWDNERVDLNNELFFTGNIIENNEEVELISFINEKLHVSPSLATLSKISFKHNIENQGIKKTRINLHFDKKIKYVKLDKLGKTSENHQRYVLEIQNSKFPDTWKKSVYRNFNQNGLYNMKCIEYFEEKYNKKFIWIILNVDENVSCRWAMKNDRAVIELKTS